MNTNTGKRSLYFAALLLAAAILCLLFLRIVIGPFLLALVLAWLFGPAIEKFEQKGLKRPIAVVFVIAFIIAAIGIAVWFVIPLISQQLEQIIKTLPKAQRHLETSTLPALKKTITDYIGPSKQIDKLQSLVGNYEFSPELILNTFSISRIIDNTRILAGWALTLVLAPLFSFFLMKDFHQLIKRATHLVPPDLRNNARVFAMQVDRTLRAVVRGQLLVISLLATLYATAFAWAGLPGGVAVGVLTGIARIVPYLDIIVGSSFSFLIILANNSPASVIIGVLLAFAIIQLLDAFFLTPKIMGQFSGLHPFLIIISVLCFGDWFGFYGVILAIPLASFGRVALLHLLDSYRESAFYRGLSAHGDLSGARTETSD